MDAFVEMMTFPVASCSSVLIIALLLYFFTDLGIVTYT